MVVKCYGEEEARIREFLAADQVVLHPGCGCVTQISSVKICRTVHQQKNCKFY